MNRCLSLLSLVTALLAAPATAQDLPQRIPPMAANALRGELVVTLPPEILLNGQPARLSPGARIRGRNNLLLLSGTVVGQTLQVRYLPDTSGLVHQVWILNDVELQAKP
jgi:hypothetical protein